MAAQKKKVLFKRETDPSFGFLKIETSIKPESRLSKFMKVTFDFLFNVLVCFRDAKDDQGEQYGERV